MAAAGARSTPMKTDPELTRRLDAAERSGEAVEAVFMLRPPAKSAVVASEKAREIAESAIARVAQEVGVSPAAVNVLTNLGMVVVAAEEPFLRRLLDQPEFASAAANATDESDAANAEPPGASLGSRSSQTRAKHPKLPAS